MAHMAIRRDMDMCNGPMLGKLIRFAVPVAVSGILQQLYNSADMAVVGRFAGKEALAAVGATGALINLIVNLFMGFSIGAGVAVSRARGAQEPHNVSRAVHTSIALAGITSLVALVLGVFFSGTFLLWMGAPADVLPGATVYMRIYFVGIPFNLMFNFGSAILRAVGDTKRPLYYLSLSGLVNVGLNLIFVIVFHMGIAGVALATIISQAISAVLVLMALLHTHEDDLRLDPRKLRIHKPVLMEIVRIGLPSGIQNSLLSFANVLIQSAINTFGSAAIAGGTAAQNIQGYVWTLMNGLHQANTTFTSQNRGARKIDRVRRVGWVCIGLIFATGLVMGALLCWLGPQLLSLYNTDPEVIAMGMRRMRIIAPFSFAYGTYTAIACHLRGMGYSVFPMLASLIGICGFRILWLKTVFVAYPTLETIFWVFPSSLVFTIILILSMDLYVAYRALPRQMAAASTPT